MGRAWPQHCWTVPDPLHRNHDIARGSRVRQWLFSEPGYHEVGLLLAIILGMLALGKGFQDHGLFLPATVGALGIGMMGGALTLPHGGVEIAFTVVGVTLLGLGHLLNHRAKT